jgi:Rieske Fe-S protein
MRARAETTRRQFLMIMGGLAAAGASLFGGIEALKFMFPQASGNAPALFKTSFTFAELTGGHRQQQARDPRQRALRDRQARHSGAGRRRNPCGVPGVHAPRLHPQLRHRRDHGVGRLALCREGARVRTPNQQLPNGWARPCHGSRYFIDSTNFYGPAPRPMDWVNIEVTPDGFFAVDRGTLVVTRGPGNNAAPQWRLLVGTQKSNGKTLGV